MLLLTHVPALHALLRLSWCVLAYAYRTVGGSCSSAQVEFRNVRDSAGTLLEGKKYTYDALGNITMISQSTGSNYPLVAYEYDAQNQLVKETYYITQGTVLRCPITLTLILPHGLTLCMEMI